jgi:hypothetical protein
MGGYGLDVGDLVGIHVGLTEGWRVLGLIVVYLSPDGGSVSLHLGGICLSL